MHATDFTAKGRFLFPVMSNAGKLDTLAGVTISCHRRFAANAIEQKTENIWLSTPYKFTTGI